MFKMVTSITVFNDAVGTRMSITYSEIDEVSGKVISDNKRLDRVVTDKSALAAFGDLKDFAQNYVDSQA